MNLAHTAAGCLKLGVVVTQSADRLPVFPCHVAWLDSPWE